MLCFYLGSILLVDSYFFIPHSFALFFWRGFVIKFMKRKRNQNYNKIRLQPLKELEELGIFA